MSTERFFIIRDGDHDKLPEEVVTSKEEGRRYLRAQDLKDFQIIDEKPIYISEEYFNKQKRSQIFPNDLLISIMASIGLNAIVPDGFDVCIANRAIGILRLKKGITSILPEYVQILINTNVGYSLFEIEKKGGIQLRLNLSDIANVKIPVPSLCIQQEIVSFYQEAYDQKQQKDAEAKALLDSINSYLLGELGVTLPEKDNSLQKRVFTTQFSKIAGGRLDPDYYKVYYADFLASFDEKYSKAKLKEISSSIFQGVGRCLSESSLYTLLKVKNIKQGNIIDFEDVEYVESVPKDKILLDNDILSPFIGEAIRQFKFAIFKEQAKLYTIDNNAGVIRIKPQICNADYVCEALNSSIGKIQIQKLIGGGVPFMGSGNVQEIYVPLPPLEKQNEIAKHIQSIREQAKQLQNDAKEILKQAKQQVELMILGQEK